MHLQQDPPQRLEWQRRLGSVDGEPGAIGTVQLDLGGARGRWPSRCARHLHTAQRQRGYSRGRLLRSHGHLFFEGMRRQPHMLSHTAVGYDAGEGHGLIPSLLRNAVAQLGARLTPVLKLARSLVKLMVGMQRGVDGHHRLHVIRFLS